MAHENGFSNDGTDSARPGKPHDSGDQMNQKDDDLAHAVDGIKRSKTVGIWLFL